MDLVSYNSFPKPCKCRTDLSQSLCCKMSHNKYQATSMLFKTALSILLRNKKSVSLQNPLALLFNMQMTHTRTRASIHCIVCCRCEWLPLLTNWLLGLHNWLCHNSLAVSSSNLTPSYLEFFKEDFRRLSRSVQPFLCTLQQDSQCFWMGGTTPKTAWRIWTPSSTWFLGPTKVSHPSAISIGSVIFAGFMNVTNIQTHTHKQTDHATLCL